MKIKIYVLSILLFCSIDLAAQISDTREAIIEFTGEPHERGKDSEGNITFIYKNNFKSDDDDDVEYTRTMVLYFIDLKQGQEVCSHLRFIYPLHQMEHNIDFFDQNFEKTGEDEWYDPLTGCCYWISHKDVLFSFLVWK